MWMASGLAWKALENLSSLARRASSAAFRALMSRTWVKVNSRPSAARKLLLISTGVAQVAIHFNTPQQQNLPHIHLAEAKRYMEEGHFAAGSMKPKIEAAIRFLEAGGQEVLITSPEHIAAALAGDTGTRITKE